MRVGTASFEGLARPATDEETDDLSGAFCREIYMFDRTSFVVNQRGMPTARRIHAFYERWCAEGTIVVVDLTTTTNRRSGRLTP
jgi:hypothetical protein